MYIAYVSAQAIPHKDTATTKKRQRQNLTLYKSFCNTHQYRRTRFKQNDIINA